MQNMPLREAPHFGPVEGLHYDGLCMKEIELTTCSILAYSMHPLHSFVGCAT
jgi:hypothetical protein